jgi:hypothetical protein
VVRFVGWSGNLEVKNGGILHFLSPALIRKVLPLISMQMNSMASFLPEWVILVVSALDVERPIGIEYGFFSEKNKKML